MMKIIVAPLFTGQNKNTNIRILYDKITVFSLHKLLKNTVSSAATITL